MNSISYVNVKMPLCTAQFLHDNNRQIFLMLRPVIWVDTLIFKQFYFE